MVTFCIELMPFRMLMCFIAWKGKIDASSHVDVCVCVRARSLFLFLCLAGWLAVSYSPIYIL
jgi:hypothetical protein